MSKRQARIFGNLELSVSSKRGLEDEKNVLRVCHNHDGGIGIGYGR